MISLAKAVDTTKGLPMTTDKNPFGHTFSYRTFEGWDLSIGKQLAGITDRISYVTCNCECGWTGTWKTKPWNGKTGKKTLVPEMIANDVRDAHDHEVGQVTTW